MSVCRCVQMSAGAHELQRSYWIPGVEVTACCGTSILGAWEKIQSSFIDSICALNHQDNSIVNDTSF